jgi:hypothetical protein
MAMPEGPASGFGQVAMSVHNHVAHRLNRRAEGHHHLAIHIWPDTWQYPDARLLHALEFSAPRITLPTHASHVLQEADRLPTHGTLRLATGTLQEFR